MGLNLCATRPVTEEHLRLSYSGFHGLRVALAGAVGIDLEKMPGFECTSLHANLFVPSTETWPDEKEEPLVILLQHSDCDGAITHEEAEVLAPRLREIRPRLEHLDLSFLDHVVDAFIALVELVASDDDLVLEFR